MNERIKKMTLLVLATLSVSLQAQKKHTISGTISDSTSGEQLIGAVVSVMELKGTGTTCNEYGFFSLTLPEGKYTLLVNMIGFNTYSKKINLDQNMKLNPSLVEARNEMEEVVVTGERKDVNVTQAQMGVERLDIQEVNKIPVLMGEKDVLKTIQLLPGVKSAGEGNAGFYVRGGGADQNLILLDEAPVYNASHLLGFFSTFNSDAVKDLTIYKGSMPAQYGGRLSSVLDIKMNDGNDQKYHVGGGIGIISSKLFVEGPIVKDKGSFLVTGRRTYADAFLKLSGDSTLNGNQLFFYDLNGKASYRINDKNRIFLSVYNGRDKLGFGKTFNVAWGNSTASLRWNHIVNSKMFSNTSFIFSNFNYRIGMQFGKGDVAITSSIQDYNLKQEFQFFPDSRNKIRFGFNAIHHKIMPGQLTASESTGIDPAKLQDKYALENAVFLANEWNASKKINVTYGLRASAFSILGKGEFYKTDRGMVYDTMYAGPNEILKTYFNLEPRLSASYMINQKNSFKASYARNVQNLHLVSNSRSASPTDIWLPSSLNTKPGTSDQYAIGYSKNMKDNMYEFSSEIYYKDLKNQIDYKDGAKTQGNEHIESELLYGIGRAYGIEVLLKKKQGKFTGWIGYTLSRSERKIDGINNGSWYLAKQDRTHDISIVGIYELSKKWSLSSSWVYYTGNAVTFPSGKYMVDGEVNFQYTERNGYRMPAYHRLDLGATWTQKKTNKLESSWNFSIYNAYARENAYMIQFQEDPDNASRTQAIQTTLFKIVPSITYNFKF